MRGLSSLGRKVERMYKEQRKATAHRNGDIVTIRMTGGPDCLWLNMYLDTIEGQMTCDSDIGFYAYHWGKSLSNHRNFVSFCCEWLADEKWLLRKCIGERHCDKGFVAEETRRKLLEVYKEVNEHPDEAEVDTYFLEEAISRANQFDDVDAWAAVLQEAATSLDVELPDEWWECIKRDYTPWQKRFAEICREIIVPELEKLVEDVNASPFDGGMSQQEYFGIK